MMAQAGALGRFEKSGSKISSTTRGEGDGLRLRQFWGTSSVVPQRVCQPLPASTLTGICP